MRFDADRHGNLALGLEGGHGTRRVVHAGGSATGRRILRQLSANVAEHPSIEVLEGARAARLVAADGRCTGVALEDGRTLAARGTILATGGAAALWSRTTNPPGSFGSGLLLARDAGAALADLEFVQFHPTAVVGVPGREGFLITEAIRGEGATLHDCPRRALRRRAGAARRRRPRDLPHAARAGDPGGQPRHATRRPRALPERRRRAARRRARPRHRAGAGRARQPLRDGRHRHRPARDAPESPGCTRSARAPAPACTAPTGWPRTRCRSASCSAAAPPCARSTSRRPTAATAPGRARSPPPPTRETRKAMWRHAGLERDAERPAAAARRPAPARAARRPQRALPRGEPRRPRPRRLPRDRPRARPPPHGDRRRERRAAARALGLSVLFDARQTEHRFAS